MTGNPSRKVVCLLLLLMLPARAGGGVNIAPSDPQLDWSFFRDQPTCSRAICQVLTSKVMAQKTQHPSLCTLFTPDPDFSYPAWQTQNYRTHVDRIKSFVISGFFGNEDLTRTLHRQYPSENIDALRKRIWDRYGLAILALFKAESARYQTADFDVDSDGKPEKLYRISAVDPVRAGKDFVWHVRTCDSAGHFPQFGVRLDLNAEPALDSYPRRLSDKFDNLRILDFFGFRGASYFFGGNENGASVSDIWADPGKERTFDGIRWGGSFNRSRTMPNTRNIVWVR